MKLKLDNLSESFINRFEALHYEFVRTRDIISYMLSHNVSLDSDSFRYWDEKNQAAFLEYRFMHEEFENTVVLPFSSGHTLLNWELNFYKRELNVEVDDA